MYVVITDIIIYYFYLNLNFTEYTKDPFLFYCMYKNDKYTNQNKIKIHF